MATKQKQISAYTPKVFTLDYKASPTAKKFHASKAFVRGLMGPVGSGKSVACCVEMFVRAKQQAQSIDGIRRTRWLVVRNTMPELETTTIKTWLDWFPESVFGKMNRKPPYTHFVKIDDIEMEVIFLALDKPEDVKKLQSLEPTGIWINEARNILYEVISGATSRPGRYPSKKEKPPEVPDDQWPTWSGVIMDTNPPDEDHWWYKAAEEDAWKIDEFGNMRKLEDIPMNERWDFYKQPSGLSDEAENIENLPDGYYRRMVSGKTKEWVRSYVHGEYAFIQEGKPVYGSTYNDEIHVAKELEYIQGANLYVGVDFGLTPAAVIGQKNAIGQLLALEEFITPQGETCPLPQFAQALYSHLQVHYPGLQVYLYGDPAGGFRDQQGKTAFDIFRQYNLVVHPAPTNKIELRREAVLQPMLRMIDGQPGFLLNAAKCKMLRRGFNGGYKYKRINVSGEAKYALEPDKNSFSHVHDAWQYLASGVGEYRSLIAGKNRQTRTVMSKGWSVF